MPLWPPHAVVFVKAKFVGIVHALNSQGFWRMKIIKSVVVTTNGPQNWPLNCLALKVITNEYNLVVI